MDDLYILAKMDDSVLVINGKHSHSLEDSSQNVKCVKIDLKPKTIYNADLLQRQLKFGTWEVIADEERVMYSKILYTEFSDKDIYEKLIIPLVESQ